MMDNFPYIFVFSCLFTCGFALGYYCKFVYIYDNLWSHWYTVIGVAVAFILSIIWTLKKYKQRYYCYEHFYIMFYGLICFVISSCFMIADNLDISFYFVFIGLSTVYIPSFSYISLRCGSNENRSLRIALGNTIFFGGVTTGFTIFNELEPRMSGWAYLSITLVLLVGIIANEILQHFGIYNYKESADLSFNMVNDEKLLFLNSHSVYATFVGRNEFYIVKNRQWLVVGLAFFLVLEHCFIYSASFLQLSWSSSFAYTSTQYLYGPFLLYTIGCSIGCALMMRYKPKLIYLMIGMIKMTATAAILGIYDENTPEQCFIFICFYYVSMGTYSSVAIQMILECSPFLLTELILAIALCIDFTAMELMKYETLVDDTWQILMIIGITTIVWTTICIVVIQFFLINSKGLIDMRNKLLGVRKHPPTQPQTNITFSNNFLKHNIPDDKFKSVIFEGNRIFKLYTGDKQTNLHF